MHVGFFIDGYLPVIDGVITVADAYASRLADKCDVTVFTPSVRNTGPEYDGRFPYKVVRCRSIYVPRLGYVLPLPHLDAAFCRALTASAVSS